MNDRMLKKLAVRLTVLVAILGAIAPIALGGEASADAAKILDRYIEVTGGKDAYAKVETRRTTGTIATSGFTFQMELVVARPGKSHTKIDSDVTGTIEKGTDGKVVWEQSAMTGPVIKDGDERILALRGANLDAGVNWREVYDEVELAGEEKIGDADCDKVVLRTNGGPTETRWYDRATGLVARTDIELTMPMGTITSSVYPSDYREEGGLLIPHKMKQVVAGRESSIEITKVEDNVEIPDGTFDLPAAVQELVSKKSDG